ncbi:ABC transporter ATP-binding protein [Achromobacter marplatensis]|jgi:capsular polysaccharide transport system ATP-binding protein|uniref:ABC transporter ATP-binding protein n=1 Tax=Achromobacter marplatensis TaxID=470868 RepID=UPI00054F7076|nr:ABC transporter ATP-binding protein [Achromobacter marplatensis]
MIIVDRLTKSFRTTKDRLYAFRNLSFAIPSGRNVAILGKNGAGKSTLLRLLAGQDTPDSGKIMTSKRISFPVGLSGGFQGSLTGRENAKFVARVMGAEGEHFQNVVKYVEDFAEIGIYFDRPVNTYSSGMRGRLAFGMSFAFDFDYYLVDEALSVGDSSFKRKAEEEFKRKIGAASMIMVTHSASQARSFCDMAIVLKDGVAHSFDDMQEGLDFYQKL